MKRTALIVLVVLVAILAYASAFVVPEWEQVVVTRFGEPKRSITTPGLKFKVPIIDEARRFDRRFLEWDGSVTEIPTKEKRNILVDTYARWRITDPLVFLERFQDERRAQSRLDGILNGETRDAVARHKLAELIRTTDREPAPEALQLEKDVGAGLEPIEIGREAIRQEILRNAQEKIREQNWGIELLDVQFKRINYVDDVARSVFERMVAERKRIADRYRSEGEGEASEIRGEKERKLKEITSGAYRTAQEIVGGADAQATEIYARAYDRSADSRSFYEFLKTMESYAETFDGETSVVLSTGGDFYRFLVEGGQ